MYQGNDNDDDGDLLSAEVEDEGAADKAAGINKDDKDSDSKGGKGRGKSPPAPYTRGLFSSFGRRADQYPGTFAENVVLGFLIEGIDYKEIRSNTWRSALNVPDWGRTPHGPYHHVRQKSEFLMIPCEKFDTLTMHKPIAGSGDTDSQGRLITSTVQFEEVKSLQPRELEDIPKGRLGLLWAQYGPLHDYQTAESRAAVRRQYPHFRPRPNHDYSLIEDPYAPTADEMLRVINPELRQVTGSTLDLSDEERKELVGDDLYSQWTYMNGSLQSTYIDYLAVLVATGCLQDPRGFNPYASVFDPHFNDCFRTEVNAAAGLELNESGHPVAVNQGEAEVAIEGGEEGDESMEGGRANLFVNKPMGKKRLTRLITTPEQAIQRYQETRGYRFDFNPDPEVYRDLWGNCYDERNPELGIVSDTERFAERLYELGGQVLIRKLWDRFPFGLSGNIVSGIRNLFGRAKALKGKDKPERPKWVVGPIHSATDLIAEMPVEELVVLGKKLRDGKLQSREKRLYSTGNQTFNHLESDTGSWLGTWVPRMAECILADAGSYLEYLKFWLSFSEANRGTINAYMLHQVRRKDFEQFLEGVPIPTDFTKLCDKFEYFKFDPQSCWYGYDSRGVPRVPDSLLTRLVKEPSLGGVNMPSYDDGGHVLDLFRERTGVMDSIKDFWVKKIPGGQDQCDRVWKELINSRGINFLTMGFILWNPMDRPSDFENGFLFDLYQSQPILPLKQKVDGLIRRLKRENFPHLRTEINKAIEGRPITEALIPIIHDWYQDSDERVWNNVYWFSEAGSDLGNISGAEAFSVEMASKLNQEGFGLCVPGCKECPLWLQQERQERLFEIGLKSKYYTTMKGILEWWSVRRTAIKLFPEVKEDGLGDDRTWPNVNELKLKVASALESRKLLYSLARDVLWPHLKRRNLIGQDEEFPNRTPSAEKIDWAFQKEELNLLVGNEDIPSLKTAEKDPEAKRRLEAIGIRNQRRFTAIQTGTFFEINQ